MESDPLPLPEDASEFCGESGQWGSPPAPLAAAVATSPGDDSESDRGLIRPFWPFVLRLLLIPLGGPTMS